MRLSQVSAIARGCFALAALAMAGVAQANVGTGLPMDQYNMGTEQTTLVPNGNFEAVTSGTPDGWSAGTNPFQVNAPVGGNTYNSGNFAAQGPFGAADQTFPAFNGYSRSDLVLQANTTYVLSAYLWNFAQNFDIAVAEVRDNTGALFTNASIALTRMDAEANTPSLILDGSQGVFGYSGFNTGSFSGNATVIVKFDQDSGGPAPQLGGQIDNVAVTPLSQFRPPNVPEPACLSLLALGALLRRRR